MHKSLQPVHRPVHNRPLAGGGRCFVPPDPMRFVCSGMTTAFPSFGRTTLWVLIFRHGPSLAAHAQLCEDSCAAAAGALAWSAYRRQICLPRLCAPVWRLALPSLARLLNLPHHTGWCRSTGVDAKNIKIGPSLHRQPLTFCVFTSLALRVFQACHVTAWPRSVSLRCFVGRTYWTRLLLRCWRCSLL